MNLYLLTNHSCEIVQMNRIDFNVINLNIRLKYVLHVFSKIVNYGFSAKPRVQQSSCDSLSIYMLRNKIEFC